MESHPMKAINTLLIGVFMSLAPLSLHAQSSKDNQAKAYYFVALEAFEAKQYDEVLASIKNVEDLLGSSNARLSALKVKTYFEQNKLDKAKAELDTFFSYQSSDEQGREMASYLRKIDNLFAIKEEQEQLELMKKKAKAKAEEEVRELARIREVERTRELERKQQIERAREIKKAQLKDLFGQNFGMVTIPAGVFNMGLKNGNVDQKPVHRVTIQAFRMGGSEVTFDQWDACISDGGCTYKPSDANFGRGNRPVINVSYEQITQQFIPWLNNITDETFRLPSEAEWEYAARAGSNTKYSWGNNITCSQARYSELLGPCNDNKVGTAIVKSYLPNAFGLYDMHGNAQEWVQDCYHPSYEGAPNNGKAWLSNKCSTRVLRGGAWNFGAIYIDSYVRMTIFPQARKIIDNFDREGFRLAQDIN